MPFLQIVILALVQGITEFLPISSSAHLVVAPALVDGWRDQGPLIDLAAHVGSLPAVLLYFRAETAQLFRGGIDTLRFRQTEDRRLFLFIACATVPILAFAAVLVLLGLQDAFRSTMVIGWTSIIFGVLLFFADRVEGRFSGLEKLSWAPVMLVGLSQAAALIPGVSRSGVTMTAARFLGFTRSEAARFSMLLAIPTILALGAFAGLELIREGDGGRLSDAALVALLSFGSAYLAIAALMRLVERIGFTPFVIYRIVFGAALLIFATS